MNFILEEMTAFKYFMPLIIEGNKNKIISTVFIGSSSKYTSPQNYLKDIKLLSEEYGFQTSLLSSNKINGITFFVEGVGINKIKGNTVNIILTYLRDFSVIYKYYIDKANYVILPSKFFAEHYGTISDKNLYLGSPKYDVKLDIKNIEEKYDIKYGKNALFVFPLLELTHKIDIKKIYKFLRDMGYMVIVKTRGKAPVPLNLRGDRYFEDFCWYPHTTMELLKISDIVINFGSTTIKECVMMNKPLINFDIKPQKHMGFLYNEKYSIELNTNVKFEQFKKSIDMLISTDISKVFLEARHKYLFNNDHVSKDILNKVL